jgi:hypothetical protein
MARFRSPAFLKADSAEDNCGVVGDSCSPPGGIVTLRADLDEDPALGVREGVLRGIELSVLVLSARSLESGVSADEKECSDICLALKSDLCGLKGPLLDKKDELLGVVGLRPICRGFVSPFSIGIGERVLWGVEGKGETRDIHVQMKIGVLPYN